MSEAVPTLNPDCTMLLVMDYQVAIVASVPTDNLLTQKVFPRQTHAISVADLSSLLGLQ